MASVHEYKRLENNLVQRVKEAALGVVSLFVSFFRAVGRFLTHRYTVVFVPHSEKKVYNLHVNVFSIICFFLLIAGFVTAIVWYGSSYSSARGALASKDTRLKDVQASLDQMRDETSMLLKEARGFETALSGTLSALGLDVKGANGAEKAPGDLSAFFDIKETPEGALQEVDDMRKLSSFLSSAVEPVKEIGAMLDSQSALLTEIPSIWPIKGGIGHISMFFGQNENPFTGQYYIHKGIDLSTYRQGDPVVATADGQVVTVDYDKLGGFGNYVIIRHKHGFYTRYAHLQSAKAKTGQRVQQGEVIGYIGNTGLSTGPHLHYEVHIGSDVVDPYKYINIRSSIAKPAR